MSGRTLRIALVTDVFHDDPDGGRLLAMLNDARGRGAELAVLPELPLDPWVPATREARQEDAEGEDGPRRRRLSALAEAARIALLGGAIVRDATTGRRHGTALLHDAAGALIASYRKVHLPEEEGYWETSHYEPGERAPEVVHGLGLPVGLQICSDVNRPQGFQILAAGGAMAVLAPRATPPETYERWKLVLRANAILSSAYVISVNRPGPEPGASVGGPSLAIDPFGEVLVETTDTLSDVTVEEAVVEAARAEYPGYLARFPRVYAEGWARLTTEQDP